MLTRSHPGATNHFLISQILEEHLTHFKELILYVNNERLQQQRCKPKHILQVQATVGETGTNSSTELVNINIILH